MSFYHNPTGAKQEPQYRFNDDEPLLAGSVDETSNASLQNVSIKAVPELDAVAASESMPNFAVVVGLKAPHLSEDARAPIDLVTVLDVSYSMKGPKLDLVKRAVDFVIDNLGSSDRLSIVCFSRLAQRVFPLRRMTEQGRVDAKRALYSVLASPGTNIVDGLKKGVQVLEERLHRNPVASIMFLSDGQDTYNHLKTRQPSEYLPASISGADNQQQTIPVHAFGFGRDHDSLVMHAVSVSSGGTFSFIESYEMVQGAFASCIGGLLSIVVRGLRLMLKSASHGVCVNSIPSGNCVSEISNQGSSGTIAVGDLYADEEKEFLINIHVPVYSFNIEDEGNEPTTPLLDITCSYKDVLSNERVHMEFVEIRRPGVPSPCDVKVKLEVDRQRNRVDATEGFVEAQRVAETGDLRGARAILSNKRSALLASASGQAGDGFIVKLEAEMKETEERMRCKRTYEEAGRAYALSNISAHVNQRATTKRQASGGDPLNDAYVTPNMVNMVTKAQHLIKIEDVKKEKC